MQNAMCQVPYETQTGRSAICQSVRVLFKTKNDLSLHLTNKVKEKVHGDRWESSL